MSSLKASQKYYMCVYACGYINRERRKQMGKMLTIIEPGTIGYS